MAYYFLLFERVRFIGLHLLLRLFMDGLQAVVKKVSCQCSLIPIIAYFSTTLPFSASFSANLCPMASKGRLVVFYGCMFAGKTTALINYISSANLRQGELLVFKPAMDSRAARNFITTHDGKKHECIAMDNETALHDLVTPYTKLIALDEAQFFDKLVFSELNRCLSKGIDIVASGLDKDYLGRPFGLMPLLMQNATELNELNANCDSCGSKATHTYRKEGNKVLVLIGAKNYYEARCEDCYRSGMLVF